MPTRQGISRICSGAAASIVAGSQSARIGTAVGDRETVAPASSISMRRTIPSVVSRSAIGTETNNTCGETRELSSRADNAAARLGERGAGRSAALAGRRAELAAHRQLFRSETAPGSSSIRAQPIPVISISRDRNFAQVNSTRITQMFRAFDRLGPAAEWWASRGDTVTSEGPCTSSIRRIDCFLADPHHFAAGRFQHLFQGVAALGFARARPRHGSAFRTR